MRYTWPKFKLCRREGLNLFGPEKYNVKKRRWTPWQHGANMTRLSEYWKLLRNKQSLKRMYMLTEKQFRKIVMELASKYSKNKWLNHDKVALQFLERRLDSIVYKAWLANTIIQARQIVTHGHLLLNWIKHNIPSYFVKAWDVIEVRKSLKTSPLYADCLVVLWKYKLPSYIKFVKSSLKLEVIDLPKIEEIDCPADMLKVIEYYAR
jgi:small subunit ribosomal protein S4